MNENELHEVLSSAGLDRGAHVLIGHGDDMASVSVEGAQVFISSDMLLEGRHFHLANGVREVGEGGSDLGVLSGEQIGRKALACCLSDCAAMAVVPVCAVVSLAVRQGSGDLAVRVMEGMRSLVESFGCPVVGGDTVSWDSAMAVDVSVVARATEGVEPVLRSGARVGDGLYVTGTLGGSLLEKHWSFQPRVQEAISIRRALGNRVHGMMDLSDGLAMDLPRLCAASGVGGVLDEGLLMAVASEDARRMCADNGRPITSHVLEDGEDFELLVAIEGDVTPVEGVELIRIGEVLDGSDVFMRGLDGRETGFGGGGFEHKL